MVTQTTIDEAKKKINTVQKNVDDEQKKIYETQENIKNKQNTKCKMIQAALVAY